MGETDVVMAVDTIADRILTLRGQRVILDAELAALYGVEVKRLNEQARRNSARFPPDFMFSLDAEEWGALRSQFATLKTGRGQHRKYLPNVFTEHGAIMAATVLNSPSAVEVSIYVVRAFVRLRESLASTKELSAKLDALERRTELLSLQHDTFADNTRSQMKQVFEALRQLMTPPPAAKKRPIGFVTDSEPAGKRKG